MADDLKALGNKAFQEKKYDQAVEYFSQAIEKDPSNHVLYSNRSGAYASQKNWTKALDDATKTTEIKPDWSKGWSRKGGALHGQGDLIAALDAYDEALKLDANNAQAKSGKESVNRAIEAEARQDGVDPSGGLGSMFNDPNLYQKLANNPKTSGLLGDAEFMRKLDGLKKNPNAMGEAIGDPRFMSVLSVLLGIDMQASTGGPGYADEAASKMKQDDHEDVEMPDARPQPSQPKKAPEPEPVAEPETEEDREKKKAKEGADAEKAKGTAAYKKRDFDTAITHYEKAWDLHKDITYLTNLSAAKFEKGDYKGAIEAAQKAVTEGREILADFKLIAKAFGRIGSSYEKLDDLTNAIEYYNRSLTEHRTPDILAKLRAAEKLKTQREKESYINPEEAEKARELGSQRFKESNWAGAVEAYDEMIKRAPDDPRGYSNRAACLIKLLTFPSAVADCDQAIKRDPNFIRAYLRKAQALFAMKEYSKCVDVCAEAAEKDTTGANAREIQTQQQKALQAQFSAQAGETEEETMARIQRDPEVQGILQDPVMQSILQQAKTDPASLQEHMKNPHIQKNINKLVAAGVIRMGR